MVFLKRADAKLEKGTRGFRVLPLNVPFGQKGMRLWWSGCTKTQSRLNGRSLHAGAEGGVNSEHMQAFLTNMLQRHLDWQDNRRICMVFWVFFKYQTASVTRLDVRTAVDVAKSSVVKETDMETHAHIVAALREENEGREGVCLLRECRGALGTAAWRLLSSGERCQHTYCGKPKGSGRPRDGEIMFGEKGDDEYRFGGRMWADNCWIFCDDKEKLTWMVNDIVEEMMDLDLEPTPESLWWTSTYRGVRSFGMSLS